MKKVIKFTGALFFLLVAVVITLTMIIGFLNHSDVMMTGGIVMWVIIPACCIGAYWVSFKMFKELTG